MTDRATVEARSFDVPDETFSGDRGHAERVIAGGISVWRVVFEPGWRYTEHVEPDLCTEPHAAYIEAGRLGVSMEDGTEVECGPGSIIVIPPGHDAWTVGEHPCVFIDFGENVELAQVDR